MERWLGSCVRRILIQSMWKSKTDISGKTRALSLKNTSKYNEFSLLKTRVGQAAPINANGVNAFEFSGDVNLLLTFIISF